ncbi:MAG: ATP-binding protein [Chloroflexota bacterium]
MAGEKVLVVDDRPENRDFVVNYVLKPNGYQYLTAKDGEQGLRLALQQSPDLILLDMQMPKMDGVQVLEALHQKGRDIPVILMTFHGSEELAVKVFRMGVKDYVIKPFQVSELISAMERALAEVRLRRERDALTQQLMLVNRQLERRVNALNTLYSIGKSVTAVLNLEQLLNRLVEAAVYISGAEEGFLLLVDRESNELYVRAALGLEEKTARNLRLRVQDSLAGQVVRTGEPILIGGQGVKIETAYLVKALLNVPIKASGQVIGVLGVDNRVSEEAFGRHELDMVSALAGYAGIAIENASLFGTVEGERRKLETVLANIEDAVVLVQDDAADTVILANRTMCTAFEVSGEVTGQPLAQVVDHAALLDLFRRARARARSAHAEISLPDGRTLNAHVTPIPGVGQVAVMQDITHLKELDHMKSEFVSTVSHDLRSPLTSIKGFADLLPVVGSLNAQQQDFLQKIQRGVETITELISDLLDLGRIEAGVNLEMMPCELAPIVEKVMQDHLNHAHLKTQTLQWEIVAPLPPIMGSPLRLGQAVSNLINNAIKYTPKGGQISVSVTEDDGQVVVTVQDSGIGIPPADLPYIFDKFYRVQTKETQDISGSGLGLSIVKSIIEKHQGRIWVHSQAGAGSTFSFVLPAIQN